MHSVGGIGAYIKVRAGGKRAGGAGNEEFVLPHHPDGAFLDTIAVHRYKVLHGICKQNRCLAPRIGAKPGNSGST
jgi:hypothetical protein